MAAAAVTSELGFDIGFVDVSGKMTRGPLGVCWRYRFENVVPVRSIPIYKGQSNAPGERWSASSGRLIAYESRLERDQSMFLDFDPAITSYSAQPFWLYWHHGTEPKPRRHAPDYFARRTDGSALVVDVRSAHRIRPRDAEAFAATSRACQAVGWDYLRVGASDPMYTENVRWLSGYRRPMNLCAEVADKAMEVFDTPRPLFQGAERIGPRIRTLPTIYHLMWNQALTADLKGELLGSHTMVWVDPRAAR